MTISEHLRHGRATLLARGWCQGRFEERDGRVCSVGAMMGHHGGPLLDAVYLLSRVATGRHDLTIMTWNDQGGRTRQEVLEAYDAAIAIAQQDEAAQDQAPAGREAVTT